MKWDREFFPSPGAGYNPPRRAYYSRASEPGGGIVKLSTIIRTLVLLAAAAAGGSFGFAFQGTKSAEPKALDWTQFRGAKRNAQSMDTGLLKQWPAAGPAVAWKATGIGTGFSSVCHPGKVVFTTGEDGGQ